MPTNTTAFSCAKSDISDFLRAPSRRVFILTLLAVALAGCASGETTNPENGLSAKEETCGGNQSYMETVPECLHMTSAEKAKAEGYAHDQQVQSEAKEAESVIKKREAERTANAIEGSG